VKSPRKKDPKESLRGKSAVNKINRKVEYALIGLRHMRNKSPGELTTAKELTLNYGCPFDVTSRVMQTLAQKGVLRSEQGAHGGYQITKDLNRLSLYDLIEMILGPIAVAKCMQSDDDAGCEIRSKCNIISPVQTLNRKLVEFYRGLSVAELLEPRAPRADTALAASRSEALGAASRAAASQLEAQKELE
jgi:Rrf2 family nitric oxide-sensitive transcriptional repressor